MRAFAKEKRDEQRFACMESVKSITIDLIYPPKITITHPHTTIYIYIYTSP